MGLTEMEKIWNFIRCLGDFYAHKNVAQEDSGWPRGLYFFCRVVWERATGEGEVREKTSGKDFMWKLGISCVRVHAPFGKSSVPPRYRYIQDQSQWGKEKAQLISHNVIVKTVKIQEVLEMEERQRFQVEKGS